MNGVNQTLYIPLYGKALVSQQNIILKDETAQSIWEQVKFPLKAKSRSKWLAYYMGMRAKVFDDWLSGKLNAHPEAVVLHLGCGLDSRNLRTFAKDAMWYDVDFPQVIQERQKYYTENDHYRMIPSSVTDPEFLKQIPAANTALVVMEGISMYLKPEDLTELLRNLSSHFAQVHLLMDCYTEFAARMSKYKNPVNDVGVTQVYGMDDPDALAAKAGIHYLQEEEMTPESLISQLPKLQQPVFRKLYAGSMSRKLYKLYIFESK